MFAVVFDPYLQKIFFQGTRDTSFAALNWRDLESQVEAATLKLFVVTIQYM